MIKLKQILNKGLEQTASLFTPITVAYHWVHQAAEILDNKTGLDAIEVKRSFQTLIDLMSHKKHEAYKRSLRQKMKRTGMDNDYMIRILMVWITIT
ncbi:hypothetical protein [Nostoc sp. NZL]|uniref:hypothetical protein n=1 Tax=Nostoc sp. NZL TaxID=2650612 RepID=UPI0018C555D2|nr:hypothetical protein [Nostoc sp. NZL]MBG1239680.1 hypothetical protein [Nostoc sp. NZL]